MKELSKVDILFLESIFDDIPDGEEHKFSLRYKLRKRQIIHLWERRQNTFVYKRPVIRMKYIIIAIIIACVAVLAGFGLFKIFDGFRVTDYDIYSMLYIVDDATSYPDTIEEKFYIDMDMNEYELTIANDNYCEYWLNYKKDDISLSITQNTAGYFGTTRLNSEDLIIEPTTILINGWLGIYYQTKEGVYCYIFNTEEYIISYTCNADKAFVENIVKMTKFE